MRYYYAVYRPYGPRTINMDGVQANRLERYGTRKERDTMVDREPNRAAVAGDNRIVKTANRHREWWIEDNYTFMDR